MKDSVKVALKLCAAAALFAWFFPAEASLPFLICTRMHSSHQNAELLFPQEFRQVFVFFFE